MLHVSHPWAEWQIAASIMECKLRPADVAPVVDLCCVLHQRYDDFSPALLRHVAAAVEKSDAKGLRMLLRFRAELFLTGLQPEPGPLVKLLRRLASGVPLGRGDASGGSGVGAGPASTSPAFFANAIIHFLRTCGHHFVTRPTAKAGATAEGADEAKGDSDAAEAEVKSEEPRHAASLGAETGGAGVAEACPPLAPERVRETVTGLIRDWYDALVKQVRRCGAGGGRWGSGGARAPSSPPTHSLPPHASAPADPPVPRQTSPVQFQARALARRAA